MIISSMWVGKLPYDVQGYEISWMIYALPSKHPKLLAPVFNMIQKHSFQSLYFSD